MAFMGAKSFLIILFGLALAVYLNYPGPSNVSHHLAGWKNTAAKNIIFNKNSIFYKDEAGRKTNAPILVVLHGFPTSSYDWIKVWPALLDKFSRVFAPDFLGFGLSDKPIEHNYSIMEQAAIVEYILDFHNIRDVHLLAHDYGDTVAQELLARFEDRKKLGETGVIIRSVCLLNGGVFPETNFPRITQQALLLPYLGPVLSRLSNIYTFQRGFGDVFGPETWPTPEEFQDFWALIRYNDGHLVMHKLLEYIPERSRNRYRWTGVLQKTDVPVHVIYGPADPVNPPGFIDFYKNTVPDPSISILDSHIGHYPQWEDSVGTMTAYFSFIKRLPYQVPMKSEPIITTTAKPTPTKPKPIQVPTTAPKPPPTATPKPITPKKQNVPEKVVEKTIKGADKDKKKLEVDSRPSGSKIQEQKVKDRESEQADEKQKKVEDVSKPPKDQEPKATIKDSVKIKKDDKKSEKKIEPTKEQTPKQPPVNKDSQKLDPQKDSKITQNTKKTTDSKQKLDGGEKSENKKKEVKKENLEQKIPGSVSKEQKAVPEKKVDPKLKVKSSDDKLVENIKVTLETNMEKILEQTKGSKKPPVKTAHKNEKKTKKDLH